MGSISTFGAFTTARLGIYAAQKGLDVTGHNIANINTRGYTRQRLDQMALRTGGAERYNSQYDGSVGSGVLCTGVSQLRDPYLDIRFRNESSSVGSMDAKLSVLEDLSSILDEVYKGADKDGILEAQFNDLQSQLKNLMNNASDGISDGQVRSVADSLAKYLNSYAGKLDGIKETQEKYFGEDIKAVNNILKNISDLNDSIQKSEIHGDSALELRDQRNNLLDELSQYMKISVETENISVGAGKGVEGVIVRMAGNPGYVLVDGSYSAQLSMPDKVPKLNPAGTGAADKYLKADGTATDDPALAEMVDNTNYDLNLTELKNSFNAAWSEYKNKTHSNHATEADADTALAGLAPGNTTLPNGQVQATTYEKVQQDDGTWSIMAKTTTTAPGVGLKDNDIYGSIQAVREMLTEAGEYSTKGTLANVDPNAATKRGIPYYQNALDSLAQKFASVFNGANNGYLQDKSGNYVDKTTGNPLEYIDPVSGNAMNINDNTTITADMQTFLDANAKQMGGNLFSNSSLTDDGTNITASNISISHSWSISDIRIVNSFIKGEGVAGQPVGPNSGDTTNILHLMSLFDADQNYSTADLVNDSVGGGFFKGSFQEMLGNTCATLASDAKTTVTLLNNHAASADELNSSRDGVSGVDLNDEATSLMQYQKSYSAACRLMTTLDEALDKLINGTGVVGR